MILDEEYLGYLHIAPREDGLFAVEVRGDPDFSETGCEPIFGDVVRIHLTRDALADMASAILAMLV